MKTFEEELFDRLIDDALLDKGELVGVTCEDKK